MFQRYRQLLIRILFMGAIPLISLIHVSLNTYRDNTKDIATALDALIPFVNVFVVPYVYWFAYVFLGLLYLAYTDGKKYYGLLASIVTGMLTCFVIFYFFPTTVERPDIIGGGFFNFAMRVIYSMDNPYNCFPSIHVLNATLVTMFIMSKEKSLNYNIGAVLSCILIDLSTMFIKQHVVLDVVSGTAIAVVMYMIWVNAKVWDSKWFAKMQESVIVQNNTKDNPDLS